MSNPFFYLTDDESDQLLLKHQEPLLLHFPNTGKHQEAPELVWDISPSYLILICLFVPYSVFTAT